MKLFYTLILFFAIVMAGCSGEPDVIEISNENSTVSGEQAGLVSIATDKPVLLSTEERNGQWTIKVKVQLTNKKKVAFGDYHGSTFELRLLDEDKEQVDFNFTPGATDSGSDRANTKLMDLMIAPVGTIKEFVFHYTTDDKDEKNEIEKAAKSATGVEIVNFDIMGQVFDLEENDAAPEENYADNNNGNAREIEAYTLHFKEDKTYFDGYEEHKYKDNYIVTIHMNGDVDIHMEICNPHNGVVGDPIISDYKGAWTQRTKKRGANFVDYFDIEFNNGWKDLNWCVDNECKYLYFTWDTFIKKDPRGENKIMKVDTLYVK